MAHGRAIADVAPLHPARIVSPTADPEPHVLTGQAPPDDQCFRYYAFLSYSHADEPLARWIHEQLEKFQVPRALVGRVTANGIIPARLNPIFRDRHELAASGDLAAIIRDALAGSRSLLVLCSPHAAISRWTALEIEGFKRLRPDGAVFAAIGGGEPFASELPGREAEECFPPPLRHRYDRRGRPTRQRAEPIAADFREGGDSRRLGLLKIVAGLIGVGLDELVRREDHRRQKRLRLIASASLAGMAVTSTLSVVAFQARNEAREQRKDAEGLVGFMLGDLRKKLEPLGRLDTLDSVGAKALGYYEKQDKASLSDEALAQRSRALTLMGEIANTRGDLNGALERYREALASTTEQLRRDPDNPQRLFDQAQNIFWVGQIAWQRGQIDDGATAFREYKRLAERMIELAPDNPKYRLEGTYADSNLGTLLIEQRRFAEATAAFQSGLTATQALISADPGNSELQKSLIESHAWLAQGQESTGQLDEAITNREREVALGERWKSDAHIRMGTLIAHRALGRLLATRGQLKAGIEQLRIASQLADALVTTEPGNSDWLQSSAWSKLDLAELLGFAGERDAAASAARDGCDLVTRLMARDRTVVGWNDTLRRQCAVVRGRLALASGASSDALAIAKSALRARTAKGDESRASRALLSQVNVLLGDAQAALHDRPAATEAWRTALANLPDGSAETPVIKAQRAMLLERLGDEASARPLNLWLDGIGYRFPDYPNIKNRGGMK